MKLACFMLIWVLCYGCPWCGGYYSHAPGCPAGYYKLADKGYSGKGYRDAVQRYAATRERPYSK